MTNYRKFKIYPDTDNSLMAEGYLHHDVLIIKLLFKAPRGQYHSFYNDAVTEYMNLSSK